MNKISFLLISIFALVLSACGGGSSSSTTNETTTSTTTSNSDTDKALTSLGATVSGAAQIVEIIDGKTDVGAVFDRAGEYIINLGGVKKISTLELIGDAFYSTTYSSSNPNLKIYISADGSAYTETMRPFSNDCSEFSMGNEKRTCKYSARKSISHIKIEIRNVNSSDHKGLKEINALGTD